MKKYLLAMLLLLIAIVLYGQAAFHELNVERLELTLLHSYILGAWALLNIIIGGYMTYILEDGVWESFHHMNAAWNLINLGVAWAMLHFANHAEPHTFDLAASLNYHYRAQKLMMLNIGLDASYTMSGLLLYEHGKRNRRFSFVLRGFGLSLVLQGLFLISLDITFYNLYANSNQSWQLILKALAVH